ERAGWDLGRGRSRQLPRSQLVVDQREQLGGEVIAGLGGFEKAGQVGQVPSVTAKERPATRKRREGHQQGHRTAPIGRLADLMRTMAVMWEELELETPDEIYDTGWTIRIAPLAYLRAMWTLFWSAVRHPLSDTIIELKTGRVLQSG